MLLTPSPEPSILTDEEKAAVYAQLERLLVSPFFSHSRRFPALLRFIVRNTLDGHADLLKERTLGIEVFGKQAQYDTANDPIVRVTAAEIRKRLALYYGEPGHAEELRLMLPPGSYVPHFNWTSAAEKRDISEAAEHSEEEDSAGALEAIASAHPAEASLTPAAPREPGSDGTPAPVHRHRIYALVALVLLGLALLALFWWGHSAQSPVRAFWAPVIRSPDPVLFCVADQTEYTAIQLRDAAQPAHQTVLHDSLTAVIIDDVAPIADIAGILRQDGKRYTVRGEGATTLNDLRGGPTIFIGAYDNAWTLRLLDPLRFHFANNPEMTRFWIVDAASKRPTPWVVDRPEQIATNIYRDYAIVSRFTDSDTGRLSVVVAGIGRGGTIAAGEFLTSSAFLSQIESLTRTPGKSNIEIVLSTQIIGGEPGTPRVEASYVW